MRISKLIRSRCECHLVFITEDKRSQGVEEIPVVLNVFPQEILGLPLIREIDFTIELLPGTASISITPDRMAPVELRELNIQLEDLIEKGFIRPSIFSWGLPILFVKKKDGSMRMCID